MRGHPHLRLIERLEQLRARFEALGDARPLTRLIREHELTAVAEEDQALPPLCNAADFGDERRTGRFVHIARVYWPASTGSGAAAPFILAGGGVVLPSPASRRMSPSISSRSSRLSSRNCLAFSRPWPMRRSPKL